MVTFKVGSNIDAWCTKCKLVLAHTIEAVASDVIKRVHCNTCRGKHMFKATEPGAKKVSATTTKTASAPKSKSKASDYSRLLNNKDASKAFGYSISRQFHKGDMINHVKFGLGVVVEQKDITKIEVLFESGPKILIHGRV
jgi:DNA-directed RNA polymerase subunit RPC12/RpoP